MSPLWIREPAVAVGRVTQWRSWKQRPVQSIMYAVLPETLVLELFRIHLAKGLNCTFILQVNRSWVLCSLLLFRAKVSDVWA